MYDQREKAQRDYEWAITGAREEGREEGRVEGERLGIERGKIQMLQELLGDAPTPDSEIQSQDLESLANTLAILQQRLRDRPA